MAEDNAIGNVELTAEAGFPVIAVIGYFEGTTYAKLEAMVDKLLSEGRCALIIDFSRCVALNSVAIGQFLFLVTKIVEDYQGTLFLTQVTPVMTRVFDLAGITGCAQIASTIASAVSRLPSS